MKTRKPASFWQENLIPSSLYKNVVVSKQANTVAVLTFFDQQKGSVRLPTIRITRQPILLTKSEIKRSGYKFSKYFR